MLMTLVILVLCTALPVLGVAHIAESRRRGRAEREALESERRFRQLAESSFDMIVRFEPRTQQRTYISPAVRRLYGYEPDEAMKLSADATNPFNFVRWGNPVTNLTQANFGKVTTAAQSRRVQLNLDIKF